MIIGVPKEIKIHEYRVGIPPAGVSELTSRGHKVIVQKDAGTAIGMLNQDYIDVGAEIADNAEEIFSLNDVDGGLIGGASLNFSKNLKMKSQ